MKNINKILTVSILAMGAVGAANAKIVSQSNVVGDSGISVSVGAANTDNAGKLVISGSAKEDVSNKASEYSDYTSARDAADNGVTAKAKYPSVYAVDQAIAAAQESTANSLDGKADKAANNAGITSGNTATHTKITYNKQGIVTGGENLGEGDIPSLHLSKISDVTATATEVNYVSGVTSNVQTQLNALSTNKQDKAIGTASDAGKAVVVGSDGKMTMGAKIGTIPSGATATDVVGYVDEKVAAAGTAAGNAYQAKVTANYQMGNSSGGWTAMTPEQQGALNSGATTTNIGKIGTGTIAAKGSNGTDAATDLVSAVNAIDSRLADATTTANSAIKATDIATTSTVGVVKGGGNVAIGNDGTMSVDLSGKQDKLGSTNVVAGSGTGNVVTSVTASNGTVTVNKATGVIKDADIASDAAIAKSKLASDVQTSLGKADTAATNIGTMSNLSGTASTLVGAIEEVRTAAANAKNGVTATGSNGVSASASNGAISVSGTVATTNALGVVKGGGNVTIANDGQMDVDLSGKQDVLPVPATPSTEGVYVLTAKVGSGNAVTYYWEDIGR